MESSINQHQLSAYVAKQISIFSVDEDTIFSDLETYISIALERVEFCFSRVNDKYFFDGKQTLFNHLHTDQYAMFLYYLCNTIWRREGDLSLASKVYYLNKTLNAVDIFYEVELPDIFLLVHPLGTVLGRGQYSNYFVAYQRCTVGANAEHVFPVIDEGVAMYGGSMLMGTSHIHKNSRIAAGSFVLDREFGENQLIFGNHPNVVSKLSTHNVFTRNFRME
jgi:serine O-acetyltransferase